MTSWFELELIDARPDPGTEPAHPSVQSPVLISFDTTPRRTSCVVPHHHLTHFVQAHRDDRSSVAMGMGL